MLDRAMVNSYRLSMSVTEAVWPQFVMQVWGYAVSPPLGGPNWYHEVTVKQPYLLLQTVFR